MKKLLPDLFIVYACCVADENDDVFIVQIISGTTISKHAIIHCTSFHLAFFCFLKARGVIIHTITFVVGVPLVFLFTRVDLTNMTSTDGIIHFFGEHKIQP